MGNTIGQGARGKENKRPLQHSFLSDVRVEVSYFNGEGTRKKWKDLKRKLKY